MPQRFLKPGITTSRKWNSLDWFSQSFYTRIITIVDDFGRFEADTLILRGVCFPLGDQIGEPVPMTTVENSCEQMSATGIIMFYRVSEENGGKSYLQVTNWSERPRSAKSKFPDFDNTCEQMFANVCKCSLPKSSSSPPSSSESSSSPIAILSGKPDVPSKNGDSEPPAEKKVDRFTNARIALHWLNEKAGRHFREVGHHLQIIAQRLSEIEDDIEGVKIMLNRQIAMWRNDSKMDGYLTPQTLFAKSNFHKYYDTRDFPVTRTDTPQNPRNLNSNAGHESDYKAAANRH